MSRAWIWVTLTFTLWAAGHAGWLWYVPQWETKKAVDRIYKRRGSWSLNQFGHGVLRVAGTDTVQRDNPDTVTSFAVYDVAAKPVRIHCAVPATDNYWSLSLFAWNTDNFYTVNDRNAPAKEFDVVVIRRGAAYAKQPGEVVVESPSGKGIALIRMIVSDRENKEELARLAVEQKKTTLTPLP